MKFVRKKSSDPYSQRVSVALVLLPFIMLYAWNQGSFNAFYVALLIAGIAGFFNALVIVENI